MWRRLKYVPDFSNTDWLHLCWLTNFHCAWFICHFCEANREVETGSESWSKEELQRRTEKVCPSQPVRWGPPLFEAGFWARGDQHNGHCAHCWSVLRLQLNNHTVCFSSIRRYYKMMEDAAVLKNDGTEPAPLQLITRLWNNVIILKSETFSYWKQKENWLVT